MTDALQEKKDGLQLLAALSDDSTRALFVRSFQSHLSDLLLRMVSADLSDGEVLACRHEAMGVLAVLDKIGVQMANASDAAIRRAAQRRVMQAVGEPLG